MYNDFRSEKPQEPERDPKIGWATCVSGQILFETHIVDQADP